MTHEVTNASPGPGYVAPVMALDSMLAARLDAEEDLDDGWAGTILVEPLTALAGGILGGLVIGTLAWRALWRGVPHPTLLELDRRYLRRRNPSQRP